MASSVVFIVLVMAMASTLAADVPLYKPEARPYEFAYGVQDDGYGPNFSQNEKSDGNAVLGSYTVQLPDGRKQTVNYQADHHNGFNAEVSYYGEAQYPPKSEYPPFIVKPSEYH